VLPDVGDGAERPGDGDHVADERAAPLQLVFDGPEVGHAALHRALRVEAEVEDVAGGDDLAEGARGVGLLEVVRLDALHIADGSEAGRLLVVQDPPAPRPLLVVVRRALQAVDFDGPEVGDAVRVVVAGEEPEERFAFFHGPLVGLALAVHGVRREAVEVLVGPRFGVVAPAVHPAELVEDLLALGHVGIGVGLSVAVPVREADGHGARLLPPEDDLPPVAGADDEVADVVAEADGVGIGFTQQPAESPHLPEPVLVDERRPVAAGLPVVRVAARGEDAIAVREAVPEVHEPVVGDLGAFAELGDLRFEGARVGLQQLPGGGVLAGGGGEVGGSAVAATHRLPQEGRMLKLTGF
jgi:hypothetical protein